MSAFSEALTFLVIFAFVTGLIRGATTCTFLCGPAVLSYTLSEGRTWKSGTAYAIKFNIGRVSLITAVGALIGYFAGIMVSGGFDMSLTTLLILGYFLIGMYSMVLGVVLYRRARKRQIDPNCECKSHFNSIEKLRTRFPRLFANETIALIILGLFMGISCLLEITLFDAVILGTASAVFGANFGIATAVTGAFTMLIFGIGSSIPIIVLNASAGLASSKVTPQKINSFAGIMAIALLTMGILLVIRQGMLLIFLAAAS
jgi:cytochrome c biogenesis protein CcdA